MFVMQRGRKLRDIRLGATRQRRFCLWIESCLSWYPSKAQKQPGLFRKARWMRVVRPIDWWWIGIESQGVIKQWIVKCCIWGEVLLTLCDLFTALFNVNMLIYSHYPRFPSILNSSLSSLHPSQTQRFNSDFHKQKKLCADRPTTPYSFPPLSQLHIPHTLPTMSKYLGVRPTVPAILVSISQEI